MSRRHAVTVYSFPKQLKVGQWGESILDSYLQRRYFLEVADQRLQDQGIDRIATPIAGGRSWLLEYKTDLKADQTGNAFIETIGADANHKNEGWATKSKADILVYYLPFSGRVLCIPLNRIRTLLPRWLAQYPSRPVPNQKYNTHGILVPLSQISQIAFTAKINPRNPDF